MGVNSKKSISMVVEQKEMLEMAYSICKDYLCGTWKKITTEDICVKRMSGGLTNMLYHVSLLTPTENKEPSEVLLRIYGQTHGERALESIITDSVIFTLLSERKLGPTLHGVFPGGRIEEYIPARSLEVNELSNPSISLKIAEKMAEIHKLQIPISKDPSFLWDTIQRWLNTLYVNNSYLQTENGTGVNTERKDEIRVCNKKNKIHTKKILSKDLMQEADWLRKHLQKIDSPVVFCHNDLQEGNILIKEPINNDPDLVVIDFEYCAYNYRGFDIANHFIESTYDYNVKHFPNYNVNRHNYPTRAMRVAFIENYLKKMNDSTTKVETVLEEVNHFTLISHFFWALWSFVHDDNSQISFGYWEYGVERLNSYFRLKQKLCPTETGTAVKRKASAELDE